MRRLMMTGMTITIPDAGSEFVPPAVARVVLGGKVNRYQGFLPGIFEEALLTLEHQRPLYVLGGFGGATEVLARALLATGDERPPEFTAAWHEKKNPEVTKLIALAGQFAKPAEVRATPAALDALFTLIQQGRGNVATALRTGLDEQETQELLITRDIARAVRLVRKGLENQVGLQALPA